MYAGDLGPDVSGVFSGYNMYNIVISARGGPIFENGPYTKSRITTSDKIYYNCIRTHVDFPSTISLKKSYHVFE